MLFRAFFAVAVIIGKVGPVFIVEKTCYRRIITGKRLHERFIRHSLPCNSLQACQHQCSIEKHFTCQGFNIRLDPANVGRGICELSSITSNHLDPSRDFVYDPEFAYYERDHDNGLPNCGHFAAVPNAIPANNPEENANGYLPPTNGGPYYGGDSYGPWSTGHGTVDHGPWGSHGYGSGFYESNNPSRGPPPSFRPDTSIQQGPFSGQDYGHGYGYGYAYGNRNDGYGNQGSGIPPRGSGLPYFPGNSFGPGSNGYGNGAQGPGISSLPGPNGYGNGAQGPGTTRPGPYGYGSGGQGPGTNGRGPSGGSSPDNRGPYFGYNYGYGGGSRTDGASGGIGPFRGQGPAFQNRPYGQPGSSSGNVYGYGYGYGYSYGHGGTGGSQSFGHVGGGNVPQLPGPSHQPGPYGYGGGTQYPGRPKVPDFHGGKPTWQQGPPAKYPVGDRRGDNPNRIPTYIIIDADASGKYGGGRPVYPPRGSNGGYPGSPSGYPGSSGGYPGTPGGSPGSPSGYPGSSGGYPGTPGGSPGSSGGYPGIPGGSPGGSGGYPGLPAPRPLPPPDIPKRPRPFPAPQPPRGPPPRQPYPHGGFGMSPSSIGREVCFRREHPGYKLNTNSIRGMYETPTVVECEAMCTNSQFKCTGYSYRYSSPGSGPNCLLTDYTSLNPETHLLPDRSCDVYFKMGTCAEFDRKRDAECFLKVATNRKLDPSKLVKMVTASGMSDCELECLNSGFFTCRSYSFRHGPPVIGEPVENCFLSDWPISALTHLDFIPMPNHEVYERGSFGHGCELDVGSSRIGPRPPFMPYPGLPQIPHSKDPWGLEETWRHFTVNGWPCRAGTECELNPEAGFWACEVEGGDRAQWDYCCRPKHSCGFSRGFHYPWCYVGEAGPEQWRPCSEFYYPEFGNRYQYKPVQSHNPHPDHSYGPPRDTRPWNFGSEEYGPPSYWPISYIHAESPPNETYVWDPEEQIFYHHDDDHYELPPPELYEEHPEESPRIRFKPCGNRHPYPRAIIQKLDLKNIPKAGNPEEQIEKDVKPGALKEDNEPSLGFSPENRDKKNSGEFFPAVPPPLENLEEKTNGTNIPLNKTKEVIKEVEKIIMESTTGAEPEKNESLKKVETKHPGFFSLSLLEKPNFWN